MGDASGSAGSAPWIAARPGGVGVVAAWRAADGSRRLAAGGNDGFIQVWDADTREPVAVPGFERPVHNALLKLITWRGSNGVRLAAAGDGPILVWDTDTGNPVGAALTGHSSWVSELTVWRAADGSHRLASASADGTVRVWDPETGRAVSGPLVSHGGGAVHAVTSWVLPDGAARLASVGDDGIVRIWDPESADLIGTVRTGQARGLGSLAAWVEPDGRIRLALGGADGTVELLDPDSGSVIARLCGHKTWVHSLVTWVGAGGRARLGSASMDGTIRSWDLGSGTAVGDPIRGGQTGGTQGGLAVWAGPDGRVRLASTRDGAVHIWDAETGVSAGELSTGHTAGLWALTAWTAADGHGRLATAGDGATIRIWDAQTGVKVGGPLTRHTATVWAMATWTATNGHTMLASGGDDGIICRWDVELVGAYGDPIQGHAGWIPSMTSWHAPDGAPLLASGGSDANIRVWDPDSGVAVAQLDTRSAGCPWILALTSWIAPDGSTRIAFAGNDPSVYVWHLEDGGVDVLSGGHTGWIRALTTWIGPDGRRRMASGCVDGTVRIWDVEAGTVTGEPIAAHTGWVRALVSWTGPGHRPLLASAGRDDAVIRVWDPETGTAVGTPLTGHRSGVWALTTWTGSGGSDGSGGTVRLASTGPDGTIRLWDPATGHALRTIAMGPITIWGLSDAATTEDVLGRQRLADAIADQLDQSSRTAPSGAEGPLVVSIEGPWGSGKSTLMKLVRRRLSERHGVPHDSRPPHDGPPHDGRPPQQDANRPLTVRGALRLIRRYPSAARPAATPASDTPPRGIVTVWFNPWAHQSGEQVWAGLAYEIIEAVSGALYPTEGARQRYWFTRNLARTDRYGLRRALQRRVVSPLLGVALVAVVAPLAIALAELNKPFVILGHTITASTMALVVSVSFLLAGAVDTVVRYVWSPAAHHLPAELFHRPVTDTAIAYGTAAPADAGTDPLRRASAGALYMYQHDIGDVIDDLNALGYDLVVFVDDIDRCQPSTSVEVFEAINLFLSGVASRSSQRTHFVIGLDPQVVAAYLDQVYEAGSGAGLDTDRAADGIRATPHGDDPSPWLGVPAQAHPAAGHRPAGPGQQHRALRRPGDRTGRTARRRTPAGGGANRGRANHARANRAGAPTRAPAGWQATAAGGDPGAANPSHANHTRRHDRVAHHGAAP